LYLFIQNNFITVNKQVLIITACGDSLDYKLSEAVQSSCQVKNLVLSAFPSVCTILYKNLSNYIQIVVANYTNFFGIDRDFLHKRFFYHSHKFRVAGRVLQTNRLCSAFAFSSKNYLSQSI